MENNKILVKIKGKIAFITFNEPDSLNALTHELKKQLLTQLEKIEKDEAVKCVIFSGEGRAFCAGGDIKAMQEPYDPLAIRNNMDLSKKIISKIRNMPKITIAAVHGYAAGAGLSVALAMDHIFAEEGTKFVLSFKNVGLIPDLGLHYYLPRKIGEWKAKEWMWTGKTISVTEAMNFGFVMDEVQKGKTIDNATKFAEQLIQGPVHSYIASKLIINNSGNMKIEDVIRNENDIQTILRGTKEHEQSLEDFLKRRKG